MTTRLSASASIDEHLAAIASGDDEPVGVIYRHYQPQLARYAARQGSDDPEAIADLALWDGLRVLESMNRVDSQAFGSYVFRAASSRLINEGRRRPATPMPNIGELDEPTDGFEDAVTTRVAVRDLIASLSPAQREVIVLRFLHGLTGDETAERMGKEANAVYQLQHRAMRNLRLAVAAAGLGLIILLAISWGLGGTGQRLVDDSPADRSDSSPEGPPRPDRPATPRDPQSPATTRPAITGLGPADVVVDAGEGTRPPEAEDPPPTSSEVGRPGPGGDPTNPDVATTEPTIANPPATTPPTAAPPATPSTTTGPSTTQGPAQTTQPSTTRLPTTSAPLTTTTRPEPCFYDGIKIHELFTFVNVTVPGTVTELEIGPQTFEMNSVPAGMSVGTYVVQNMAPGYFEANPNPEGSVTYLTADGPVARTVCYEFTPQPHY